MVIVMSQFAAGGGGGGDGGGGGGAAYSVGMVYKLRKPSTMYRNSAFPHDIDTCILGGRHTASRPTIGER